MADLDTALDEALRRHDPTFYPPDTSALMRRHLEQRAELFDIDPLGPDDDQADEDEAAQDDRAEAESRSNDSTASVVND